MASWLIPWTPYKFFHLFRGRPVFWGRSTRPRVLSSLRTTALLPGGRPVGSWRRGLAGGVVWGWAFADWSPLPLGER